MKIYKSIFTIAFSFLLISCFGFSNKKEQSKSSKNNITAKKIISDDAEVAYFASGCFWCVEAIFESVKGVEEVVSGYAGGNTDNPTYQSIGTGKTGHAEAVAVYYNPKEVSFETLVTVFFGSHDPTTVNGQTPDFGTQYRSIAFYQNEKEKEIIDAQLNQLNKDVYNGKIATQVVNLKKFYEAEDYHQDFEKKNPRNGYVQNVSVPRLNKFKKKFPELLKDGSH